MLFDAGGDWAALSIYLTVTCDTGDPSRHHHVHFSPQFGQADGGPSLPRHNRIMQMYCIQINLL